MTTSEQFWSQVACLEALSDLIPRFERAFPREKIHIPVDLMGEYYEAENYVIKKYYKPKTVADVRAMPAVLRESALDHVLLRLERKDFSVDGLVDLLDQYWEDILADPMVNTPREIVKWLMKKTQGEE